MANDIELLGKLDEEESAARKALEERLAQIAARRDEVAARRTKDIAAILLRLNLAVEDDRVLAGAFMDIQSLLSKVRSGDAAAKVQVEAWADAGRRFLRGPRDKSPGDPTANKRRSRNGPAVGGGEADKKDIAPPVPDGGATQAAQ